MKKTDKKLIKQWRKWAKKNPDRVEDTMKAFAAIADKIEDDRWLMVTPVIPRPWPVNRPEDGAGTHLPAHVVNREYPTPLTKSAVMEDIAARMNVPLVSVPLTPVKKPLNRSTHPDPRGFIFDILDGLHARGTPISGRPVIDRAVANGITENTARSLVHIWRKKNNLHTPIKKGANK